MSNGIKIGVMITAKTDTDFSAEFKKVRTLIFKAVSSAFGRWKCITKRLTTR